MRDSDSAVSGLGGLVSESGLLVYEHRRDSVERKNLSHHLNLIDSREYGATVIDIFQKKTFNTV
jgi:16S rRNA G966 N2-methylase RsmD